MSRYTGMLSGYNLVLVCAESFSTAALDPEVTHDPVPDGERGHRLQQFL